MLSRAAERAEKNRPGRPRDAHKDMWTVADTFSDVLDSIQLPFPTQSGRDDGGIGANIADALDRQAAVAECMRAQQNPEDVAAQSSDIGVSALPPGPSYGRSCTLTVSGQGPPTLARALARAATLNANQMGTVALVANAMQTAWEEQGRPERMQPPGRLLRMLLLGGGGCGKTRIINLVLTALFTEYYGPRGVVKAAPSNKAARGILGKTLHAACKIGTSAMDVQSLSCGEKAKAALASLWVPAGALIIDEASQGTTAVYHALTLRSTYGHAAAHGLDIAPYAEPATTFGSMPIVVECGD